MNKRNVAIIGCGFIGRKRALNLTEDDKLILCCDTNEKTGRAFSGDFACEFTTDWKQVVQHADVNIIIVSTIHSFLTEISIQSLKAGKHVLVEKPGGVSLAQIIDLEQSVQENSDQIFRVGFNHRFHPGFIKAKELSQRSGMGELMFARAFYGHGGRVGYDQEWRADKNLSGGGELIDQGLHLIDLSYWLLGEDFQKVTGTLKTYFWDMEVEDNAFMTLETGNGKVAHLHVSWTEWKNCFSFEIYGKTAKIKVEGLGGSYGKESLSYYQMKPEMGKPEIEDFNFSELDLSWKLEWLAFIEATEGKATANATIADLKHHFIVLDKLYN